jgi:hypothetical protein
MAGIMNLNSNIYAVLLNFPGAGWILGIPDIVLSLSVLSRTRGRQISESFSQ